MAEALPVPDSWRALNRFVRRRVAAGRLDRRVGAASLAVRSGLPGALIAPISARGTQAFFDFSCAEVLEPSFVERGAVSIETVGNTEASKTTPTTVATFQPEAFLAIDQFITLETPLSNVTPRSP
ncbi:hypothetical protein JL722_11579 [Aureococcus anophagefferens]|nr:hypothetical protein JL722_11579 [Aureococcus anophagefferens]